MIGDIISAAILLFAALSGPASTTPYHDEIVAAAETHSIATNAAEAVGHPEIAPVTMAIGHFESYWSRYGTDWTGCSVGDYGSSFGEHQWHRYGLGRDYSRDVLCDRAQSYRLISEWIAVHLNAGYPLEQVLSPWMTRDMALDLVAELGPEPTVERWLEVLR